MMLETFFDRFDQITDSQNAIPRIRRFILDLAVRGRLVEQDASDESADALLRRIKVEKARLFHSSEIKKQDQLPPVAEEAISFLLPSGWVVSQLSDVAVCLDHMRVPVNGSERALRIAGKSESDLIPYYGATQQQGWIDDFLFDTELVLLGEDGVPFFDELRPKAYVISGKSWVNNHAHVFRGILTSNLFLMYWLNTFDYKGRVAGSTRSKLNQAKALDIPIALPPLAEQERIVAKVDELMALCNQLEAQQKEREERHAVLSHAALARFADAPTTANLEYIFHKSYDIEPSDLRKTILSLAVQGKLVPQDPSDEPASVLARRIRDSKSGVETSGKPTKEGEHVVITKPFPVPSSWLWIGATEPAIIISDRGKKIFTSDIVESGKYPVVDQGKVFVRGYCNDEEKLIKISSPVIVFGDHTRETKFIDFDFVVGADGVKILKPLLVDPKYYYLALLWLPLVDRGYGRHFKLLRAAQIPLPPLAEQKRIVAKAEQLIAIVDHLEEIVVLSREKSERLLEAVLHEVLGR